MVWMEKMIGEHQDRMDMPTWFPELSGVQTLLDNL